MVYVRRNNLVLVGPLRSARNKLSLFRIQIRSIFFGNIIPTCYLLRRNCQIFIFQRLIAIYKIGLLFARSMVNLFAWIITWVIAIRLQLNLVRRLAIRRQGRHLGTLNKFNCVLRASLQSHLKWRIYRSALNISIRFQRGKSLEKKLLRFFGNCDFVTIIDCASCWKRWLRVLIRLQ